MKILKSLPSMITLATFLLFSAADGASAESKVPHYDSPYYITEYSKAIRYFNRRLDEQTTVKIVRSILYYSHQYRLDPRLVVSVVAVESAFRPGATSKAGAQGLGQLMPETAAGLGIRDSYEPIQNIRGTVRTLRLNLDRWSGLPYKTQVVNALASYNAGYGAVKKYGGIPPYPETYWYVYDVISLWRKLCGLDQKK
ncbi:MAG: lytic transglycosylase domain-containing protein [Armatimonadetes bacterium]|nr:lytic transglycosylase domain-containing protein [Armatimonadota bacterium]